MADAPNPDHIAYTYLCNIAVSSVEEGVPYSTVRTTGGVVHHATPEKAARLAIAASHDDMADRLREGETISEVWCIALFEGEHADVLPEDFDFSVGEDAEEIEDGPAALHGEDDDGAPLL